MRILVLRLRLRLLAPLLGVDDANDVSSSNDLVVRCGFCFGGDGVPGLTFATHSSTGSIFRVFLPPRFDFFFVTCIGVDDSVVAGEGDELDVVASELVFGVIDELIESDSLADDSLLDPSDVDLADALFDPSDADLEASLLSSFTK